MNTLNLSTSVSPRVGALLTRITETPDLDTALWKVLAEYVDFKTQALRQQVRTFEQKWGMPFTEFARCVETETLGQDPYTYEVESDFWEWEAAETLLDHNDNRRGWHLHPKENPSSHVRIDALTVQEVVTRLQTVLLNL